ncbi:MAG: hypothetical protein MOB07_16400 [Acidobacteria bacterium]|nr:hypothetical protein [Acidobacteriota bacterium]
MIKLQADKMTKAIERAKAIRPRVRVLSVAERTYSVTGSRGDLYTVKFAVANGHKLGECSCPARGMCYHLAAAAAVNIGIQGMRRAAPAPSPADERAELIAHITTTWPRVEPHVSLSAALLNRFGKSNLNMLDTDMLRRVRLAIAM